MNLLDNFDLKRFKESQEEEFKVFESIIKRNEELVKENDELKDAHYKDKEIKRLKEENEKLLEENRLGFPISKEEMDKINDWEDKHIKAKHWDNIHNRPKSFGAIGGNFTYKFIPTGIGVFGSVKCSCGECFDFQEP